MSPAADYQRARAQGGVADLSAHAKWRLTGADRVRFLNGQVTANIAKLPPGESRPTCITTAKGKLCAVGYVCAADDALLLETVPELREALGPRLERYLIADDAALEDVTEEFGLFHLLGADPASLPAFMVYPLRRAARYGVVGWDLWVPAADVPALRETLTANLLSPALLEALRLEAGIPAWGAELTEATLPPEAGLERTHIDYHKGCYVGQETISRLKSVGHVNRLLTGFTAAAGAELQPGWRLYHPDAPEKPVGELTSTGWSPALGQPIALGYRRRDTPDGALLACLADASAATAIEVQTHSLPFTP